MDKWFSRGLKTWYKQHKRDLPWRREQDPYRIWLSEIILQQTQVVQGLSYYLKFTEAFPDVKALAGASEDQVLKLWQGLGYYSRARNLHAAAKMVSGQFNGAFPETYDTIRSLKGVGDYTAAAIASFAYGQPHAVVDGNVYRVLSRVFGIETAIDTTAGKKEFQTLASELLDKKDPGTHNQAVMEFGALHCRPVNPGCDTCVLREKCLAYSSGRVSELPVKSKKTKIRARYFNYLVLIDKNKNVLIHRRGAKDIWQGLYEFYLHEGDKELTVEEVLRLKDIQPFLAGGYTLKHSSKLYRHILSHQHLYARFYVIAVASPLKTAQLKTNVSSLTAYAFPRLIEKFLDDGGLKEIL